MSLCPRCHNAAGGAAGDALWRCLACAVMFDRAGEALPVRYTRARGYPADGVAMPFYRFSQVRAEVVPAATGGGAASRLAAVAAVWVVAVRIRHFQVHGDVGFEYTRRPPRLEAGEPGAVLGVSRSPAAAARVARVLVHKVAAEADGARLQVELGRPEVTFVPTLDEAGLVKVPHCPIRYPSGSVEGYREALACAAREIVPPAR